MLCSQYSDQAQQALEGRVEVSVTQGTCSRKRKVRKAKVSLRGPGRSSKTKSPAVYFWPLWKKATNTQEEMAVIPRHAKCQPVSPDFSLEPRHPCAEMLSPKRSFLESWYNRGRRLLQKEKDRLFSNAKQVHNPLCCVWLNISGHDSNVHIKFYLQQRVGIRDSDLEVKEQWCLNYRLRYYLRTE